MKNKLLIFFIQNNILHETAHKSSFCLIVDIRIFNDIIDILHAGEDVIFGRPFMRRGRFQVSNLRLDGGTVFLESLFIFFVFLQSIHACFKGKADTCLAGSKFPKLLQQ